MYVLGTGEWDRNDCSLKDRTVLSCGALQHRDNRNGAKKNFCCNRGDHLEVDA